LTLGDEVSASLAATKRIRQLERELARKEKALAEAAALLILKKKWGISGRARTTTPTRGTTADTQRGPGSPIVRCTPRQHLRADWAFRAHGGTLAGGSGRG
jgi:hypothetical protein